MEQDRSRLCTNDNGLNKRTVRLLKNPFRRKYIKGTDRESFDDIARIRGSCLIAIEVTIQRHTHPRINYYAYAIEV